MSTKPFHFKQFSIHQDQCAMKIGTDGVLLGAWCDHTKAKTILDIGTGTGVIAIMQAQRNHMANIVAIEIDEAASKQAAFNFENNKWKERLAIQNISLQDFALSTSKTFDLIVCNPPFYRNSDFTKATGKARSIARNDEALSFQDLIQNATELMHLNSKLCVVIPFSEFERFKVLLKDRNLSLEKVTYVSPKASKKINRVLLQLTFKKIKVEEDFLIIQKDKRNDFTPEYIELVKDFYTIL